MGLPLDLGDPHIERRPVASTFKLEITLQIAMLPDAFASTETPYEYVIELNSSLINALLAAHIGHSKWWAHFARAFSVKI